MAPKQTRAGDLADAMCVAAVAWGLANNLTASDMLEACELIRFELTEALIARAERKQQH